MPSCVIPGCMCTWRKRDADIILHVFPKDVAKIQIWLRNSGLSGNQLEEMMSKVVAGKKNDSYRMCSLHFATECYHYNGYRRTLKKDAVPTIFTSAGNENRARPSASSDDSCIMTTKATEGVSHSQVQPTSYSLCTEIQAASKLPVENIENESSIKMPIPSIPESQDNLSQTGNSLDVVIYEEVADTVFPDYFPPSKKRKRELTYSIEDIVLAEHGYPRSHLRPGNVCSQCHQIIPTLSSRQKPNMVDIGVNTDYFFRKKNICIGTESFVTQRNQKTQTRKLVCKTKTTVQKTVSTVPRKETSTSPSALEDNQNLVPQESNSLASMEMQSTNCNGQIVEHGQTVQDDNEGSVPEEISTPKTVKKNDKLQRMASSSGTPKPSTSVTSSAFQSPIMSSHGSSNAAISFSGSSPHSSISSIEKSEDPDDPTYTISDGAETEDSDDLEAGRAKDDGFEALDSCTRNIVDEEKYIVFDSCLRSLIKMIPCHRANCKSPLVKIKKYKTGSYMSISVQCSSGHKKDLWQSQPRHNSKPLGNILIAASVLFSGSNFLKVQQMFKLLNLISIGKTSFYKYQRAYLYPAINEHWEIQQKSVLEELVTRTVCLSGDGQMDSPGFSAKFCIYTLMDVKTKKICSFSVEQVTPDTNSVALEKKAFQNAMDELISKNVKIGMLVTDRHMGIRKVVREKYPTVIHQYDVWHLAKSIGSKVLTASKFKDSETLSYWVQAIKNHVWWCSRTCGEDANLLIEKWTSVCYHVTNTHTWNCNGNYNACSHPPLHDDIIQSTKWLEKDSAAHERLQKIVEAPNLLRDLRNISNFCHTGELEVYNSISLKYRPKRNHFYIDSMNARTQLAALDHNFNVHRVQAVVKSATNHSATLGSAKYRMEYSKGRKQWVIKNLYESTCQEFLYDIMNDVVALAKEEKTFNWSSKSGEYPPNIAPIPRPNKKEMIVKYQSRFSK